MEGLGDLSRVGMGRLCLVLGIWSHEFQLDCWCLGHSVPASAPPQIHSSAEHNIYILVLMDGTGSASPWLQGSRWEHSYCTEGTASSGKPMETTQFLHHLFLIVHLNSPCSARTGCAQPHRPGKNALLSRSSTGPGIFTRSFLLPQVWF